MHVVIVESPAKCKTINKYLGKEYTVLASFGHIRDLPSKDGSVRPDEDFAMDYEINSDSRKHVKSIADAVKKADSLILATDPDREGEAISWHVLEALQEKKALKKDTQIQRVTFTSITKDAVLEAMKNPRNIDMDLVNSQQARRALDYLVGFNLSPVLWRKLPGSRSAGRVQSVALRLICEREDEIEHFTAQEYWTIDIDFMSAAGDKFNAGLTHIDGEKLDKFAIPDEKTATKIEQALKNKEYSVASIEKKQARRNPYAPFTTSTLQQEAARKLNFSASRTMQTAQKLYEGIDIGSGTTGLITYMRTDGTDIAPEAIAGTRQLIEARYGSDYLPKSPRIFKSKAKNVQEAHEAIRPTDPTRIPDDIKTFLNEDQLKLYDLIWKRTIACQMESVVMDQVAADVDTSDGYARLRATGSTIRFDGFYRVYREGVDDKTITQGSYEGEKMLPTLNEGESATLKAIAPEQHFTQPPPRYSEASLVKKMEELGIGRPSTYASIISILRDRGYVQLDKRRFFPEPRGRVVTAFLTKFFSHYVEYDFTAYLEDELDQISAGEMEWKNVLREFWKDFSTNVDEALKLEINKVITELNKALDYLLFPGEGDIETRRKCPSCDDGKTSLKMGKHGPFLGCSNYPDCTYTRPLDSSNNNGNDGKQAEAFETRVLGKDSHDNDITVRKGPYGFYVQQGEGKKPNRTALPKHYDANTINIEDAMGLLSLPRDIGKHPETDKMITANIGRYGPYIHHDGKYVSLKGDDDVLTIGMNRAVDLIAQAAEKKTKGGKGSTSKRKTAEPRKILGKHPDSGNDVAIFDGRYGPYVKHEKLNASIPKDTNPDDVTLEQALELLTKQAEKKKKKAS